MPRYKKQFDSRSQQWYGTFNGVRVTGFFDPGEVRDLEQELEKLEKEYEFQNNEIGVRTFKDYFETVVRTGKPENQVEFAKDYLAYKQKQPKHLQ